MEIFEAPIINGHSLFQSEEAGSSLVPEEIVNLMENGEITLLSPSSFTEPQWAWNRAGNKPSRNFSWLRALSYVRMTLC